MQNKQGEHLQNRTCKWDLQELNVELQIVFSKKFTCFKSGQFITLQLLQYNLIPLLYTKSLKHCLNREHGLAIWTEDFGVYAIVLCIPWMVAALCQATDLVFDYQPIKLLSRAACSLKLHAQYGHWQMLLINYFNTTLLSGKEPSQNENKITRNPTPSLFHTAAINSQYQIFHLALQL